MNKEKLYKNISNFFILVLLLVNIFYLYRVYKDYQNIYQIQYFIPLLLVILINFLYAIFKKTIIPKKINLINLVILIIIPLTIYSTLPTYTYDDGKEIIEKSFKDKKDLDFTLEKKDLHYLETKDKSESFFIKNRIYYYKLNLDKENKEFILDPIRGELREI